MLELERFEKPDIEQLIGWLPDEAFMLQTCGPIFKWPPTTEQMEKHLEDAQGDTPTVYAYRAVDSQSRQVVGHVEIIWIDYEKSNGMLGPVLIGEPDARGKGYGQRMVKLALEVGFTMIGLDEIYLYVFEYNTSAIKCYEKVGFRECGRKVSECKLAGRSWHAKKMKMMKEEYCGDSQSN